jgi:hypothetical protein
MAKPWATPQWKKKRLEFLQEKTCQWCGSNENLAIHHKHHFRALNEYKKLVTKTIRKHFADGKNQDEKQRLMAQAQMRHKNKAKFLYLCPKCGFQVYARKTLHPKYRCKTCHALTDNPTRRTNPKYQRAIRRTFRKSFIRNHKEEVDKAFKELKEISNRDYLDFKDVEVLCRKCHYATEKGLIICQVCHKSYHQPKYNKCWACTQRNNDGQTI